MPFSPKVYSGLRSGGRACPRQAFYIFGSAESNYRTLTTPDTAHAYGLRCTPFLPPLINPLDDQITTVLDLVGGNFLT